MSGSDDVAYTPDTDGGWTRLGAALDVCLVLGDPPQQLLTRAAAEGVEVRIADGSAWVGMLHCGTYTVRDNDLDSTLVVLRGLEPRTPVTDRERFVTGHLGLARPVLQSLRAGSKAARTSSALNEGELVRVRSTGQLATVVSVRSRMGAFEATVEGPMGRVTVDVDALEVVDGDPRDPAFWVTQAPAGADDLSLTVTWTKLRHPLTDTVYSYASSKTIFRAYQFAPVLKIIGESDGRLLIADEVGLGKTIEAGLIWSELEQRSRLDRVLVVAPASLALKWKSEMGRRFDRDLQVMKPADLLEIAQDMKSGRDVRFAGVVSVESLRTATEALAAMTEVHAQLDLVIVDEAHVLRNRATRSYELGQMLSDWADVLVFLSATPLNLGQSDLFNLVNLLREEEFADEAIFSSQLEPNQVLNTIAKQVRADRHQPRTLLALAQSIGTMQLGAAVTSRPDFVQMCRVLDSDTPLDLDQVAQVKRAAVRLNTLGSVLTRTRKVDVPDAKAKRHAEQIDVVWTDHERSIYDSVRALYMAEFLRRGTPPGFGMQMPMRQAASCLPAMQEALADRHGLLTSDYEESETDDYQEAVDDEAPTMMGMEKLLTPIPVDSKYDAMEARLFELRQHGSRQVMIFSFFRRTIAYLEERLSAHFSVKVMSGATPMGQRQQIMQDFRDGKFDILVLSQVGAEGLDFEFCNALVNYDLPWNPMQVEQRIGRLDRFGQTSERIFIFNMHVPGTIESDIFERLYQRIGVFQQSIGELEPILRDELKKVTRVLLDPSLSEAERRDEADRVAVALAERAQQVRELEDARGAISTIEHLQVDGMTDNGPTEGRFVGPTEVRRLVERLLARCGGTLSAPNRHTGISRLTGTPDLAVMVRQSRSARSGSMRSAGQLAADLRDGVVLRVTFDSDMASKHQVELISSRHPLVEVALQVLEESSLSLARFGVVEVPGLDGPAGCLARLDLAQADGLTPRLELWVTAVDLTTGAVVADLGGRILHAVAHGELSESANEPHPELGDLLDKLDDAVADRRRTVQARWRADNEARIDARLASRLRSIDLKLMRARATLESVVDRDRDDRVVRLHEGRIRNLSSDRDGTRADLDNRRTLDVTVTTVGMMQVHPGR